MFVSLIITFSPADILRLSVDPEEYAEQLVEYNNMKIFALASVEGTKQTWAAEDDFQVMVPVLNITVRFSKGHLGPRFNCTANTAAGGVDF